MKIFINPGHGGNDCGACGYGLKERDVVLNIGRRVEEYLRDVGYDVKLFQFDDLQAICDAANKFNADLFVSIHCNAFDGRAHGTESYAFYGSTKGRKLADAIHKQITGSLPIVDRGVKQAGFVVLSGTDMPAALVETAFIDQQARRRKASRRTRGRFRQGYRPRRVRLLRIRKTPSTSEGDFLFVGFICGKCQLFSSFAYL